jgi:hypothetical protein
MNRVHYPRVASMLQPAVAPDELIAQDVGSVIRRCSGHRSLDARNGADLPRSE